MTWHKRLLDWMGGAIGRVAGTGMVGGALFIIYGMTPAELVAYLLENPPSWLMSGWTRLFVLIIGLALIVAMLRFNIWSEKQKAVDSLAEDISTAISDLVNRHARLTPAEMPAYPQRLLEDYQGWCQLVSAKLSNRAFFTRADQLHFDRLGFVQPVGMTAIGTADHTLAMLRLKFERLRDIIKWVQQRPR